MLYRFAKYIQTIFMKAPEGVLLFLGRFLGIVMYCIGRRRKIAFKNIKTAFPEKSNREIYAIIRKNFSLFGVSLIASFVVRRLYKYVSMKGHAIMPGGGICVGIHAGSWEVSNCFFATNFNYAILAESQKNEAFNRFLHELRQEEGLGVCYSIKELVKCVKNGYLIGMVIDHGLESDAAAFEFFSQLVPTAGGAVYLARKFNKPIYPCFPYRRERFWFDIEVGEPITIEDKSDEEVLASLNRSYEAYLQKCPVPWQYSYKPLALGQNLP